MCFLGPYKRVDSDLGFRQPRHDRNKAASQHVVGEQIVAETLLLIEGLGV